MSDATGMPVDIAAITQSDKWSAEVPRNPAMMGFRILVESAPSLFIVVTSNRFLRCFIQALDIVDVCDVGLDKFTARGNVIRRKFLFCDRFLEVLEKPFLDPVCDELNESLLCPGLKRLIGCTDCWPKIASCWFQPGIRSVLAGSVNTHQRFEKIMICECLRVRTEFADSERLLKCVRDLSGILRAYPNENFVNVASLQSFLGRADDRSIEARHNGLGPPCAANSRRAATIGAIMALTTDMLDFLPGFHFALQNKLPVSGYARIRSSKRSRHTY